MKLKPCPFCGTGDWHVMPHFVRGFGVQISCQHCGASGPWICLNKTPDYPEEEQDLATKKWNERSDDGND